MKSWLSSITTPSRSPVELLGVDAVGALYLSVQPRCPGPDVAVSDAPVEDVEVEGRLELRPVVGLDDLHPERELLEHVVEELDGRGLVQSVVEPQDPQAGAVVDGGELVVLLRLPGNGAMNFTSIWTR